jgi:hypothetical protein
LSCGKKTRRRDLSSEFCCELVALADIAAGGQAHHLTVLGFLRLEDALDVFLKSSMPITYCWTCFDNLECQDSLIHQVITTMHPGGDVNSLKRK